MTADTTPKTAEEIWDQHFEDWVMAGQIRTHAIPAMKEYALTVALQVRAECAEKAEAGWTRDDRDDSIEAYVYEDSILSVDIEQFINK